MNNGSYDEFLASKVIAAKNNGFRPNPALFPANIKPFQKAVVTWACKKGRSALFEATGLGKTIQELSWARQINYKTKKQVLIFAPLAVAEQIAVIEAQKFGFEKEVKFTRSPNAKQPIIITNYENRHHFDLSQFGGVGLDESGIIKSHEGKIRLELTESCRHVPYVLCATATPAPNDWTELGQHAELLGVMTASEMLATFFVHDGKLRILSGSDWRLKKHAEDAFWEWVASWAVMFAHPREIGYEEDGYDLPPLLKKQITVKNNYKLSHGFVSRTASTLGERLHAYRDSIDNRIEAVCKLVQEAPDEPWLIWCRLNGEADKLERAIKGSVNVQGSDDLDFKINKLLGFCHGDPLILISKPSIAGRGMNWQHCCHMIFLGLNDSFEALFQAIRRCWRFGQINPVQVYLIASELEGSVIANLKRKEAEYDKMMLGMLAHMTELSKEQIAHASNAHNDYSPKMAMELPTWLAR